MHHSFPAPSGRSLYVGGAWHHPSAGRYVETFNPGLNEPICEVADATAADIDAAVAASRAAFGVWRDVAPLERGRILKGVAEVVRKNARELAALDAANCGNPVKEMLGDAAIAAAQLEFFAGLVTEMKGDTIPMGPDALNVTVRQPLGVVARILAFNHPFMFCAGKMAAPLAAGNAVIIKPPEQAPLSSLRLAELVHDLLPKGVLSVIPGGRDAGAALASHPGVDKVAIIGSVGAGRAVMKAASDTLKPVLLELGGKNALLAFADADPEQIADAIIGGMNFTWCGQSCGSTSRAFLHKDIYEDVLARLPEKAGRFVPGIPTDDATTMGAIISKVQHDRVISYIASAREEGARLITGGGVPADPALQRGFYIEPTIFADVTPTMRIAREEIFGPVLAVSPWDDEETLVQNVNALEYGLTCSIWTNDLLKAHRTAMAVEAGFVWINEVSRHFLGAPFGGWKQSGIGREECLGELISFTQEKNIHISLKPKTR
ncbi:aldehyde dehydrogenase family protein [Ancylobacter polymorphus]|uniref:Betaine-aldehyde dehydrogenase n=1 Tax=Ancylobacter polymorphus TaxID=223390 RepID=A0ABU0BG85_9HYPH|nr:aldehyde dehydrogenase family protein [Ancylobacter polymorphus]MDQ0304850.1 betaine-aldehyde dehydrogenase [Ancylobacter polymorphus]